MALQEQPAVFRLVSWFTMLTTAACWSFSACARWTSRASEVLRQPLLWLDRWQSSGAGHAGKPWCA